MANLIHINMITLFVTLLVIAAFVAGMFVGKEWVPRHLPGDYDGDGQAYTNKDLGVFQSRRNRANGEGQKPPKLSRIQQWLRKIFG